MVACTLLGVIIERLAYKPLRQASSLAVLITAIGMSYLLQNVAASLLWGSNPKSFPSVVSLGSLSFFDGQLLISGETIVTVLMNIIIMVGLTLFTGKTKMGKAMRVVAEDKGAAELMGINVNMTISLTFAIGSALAAVAGVLLCSAYPTLMPTTGSMPGIKAFTAAVFGGIGSIPGAMLGGILLGVIEILGKAYISTELGDAIVFAVLIVVLLVRPTGLLRQARAGEKCEVTPMKSKQIRRSNLITYGIVIAAYIICQVLIENGRQMTLKKGPAGAICVYGHGRFLNLTVGISGEAEPGPRRIHERGRLCGNHCLRVVLAAFQLGKTEVIRLIWPWWCAAARPAGVASVLIGIPVLRAGRLPGHCDPGLWGDASAMCSTACTSPGRRPSAPGLSESQPARG